MTFKNSTLSLLVALALIFSLNACGPQATPVPTVEPSPTTAPTDTPEPTPTETETPLPTETPDLTAQPPAQGTQPAPAGGAVQPQNPAQPAAPLDDAAQYISQSLPDGYQVRPRTTIGITWSVKNTGKTAWSAEYALRQFAGPDVGKQYVPFPKVVSANETAQLTVTFVTPDLPGDYNLWYKLANAQGQYFSDVNFQFTVTNTPNYGGAPAATATP